MDTHTHTLDYNFLPCAKAEIKGLDILYCGKFRKGSKSCPDLDLDRTMPNVKLLCDIFKYYNISKFQVPRLIIFLVIVLTDKRTYS